MKPAAAALLTPVLILAACARGEERSAAFAPPPEAACSPPGWHFAFVATATTVYRQGATIPVAAKVDMSPAGTADLPLRCTSGWSVTGPATLSRDRTSIAISPDAPVGATVAVGFRHLGKAIEARFKVVAKDEIVLTGLWSQRSLEGCSAESIGELEFRPDNRFAVTFHPFETYQDYWGRYAWDADTGRIRLTVEGGNFVPPGLDLDGAADLAEGRLRLTGLFLGSRGGGGPQAGCTYIF
ncbi:MAG: hypothetical protein QOJ91_2020 [Sphingomonadales bacterium]|jgi:hypothetical protein|nr:hypothetical protein [Sphingomonadales bacterium]